jgi:hypothetical protein
MTQAQFHNSIKNHYNEAARKKRTHEINGLIKNAENASLVRSLERIKDELFDLIDLHARDSEPCWNGREPLREQVDHEEMMEILSDMRERV